MAGNRDDFPAPTKAKPRRELAKTLPVRGSTRASRKDYPKRTFRSPSISEGRITTRRSTRFATSRERLQAKSGRRRT